MLTNFNHLHVTSSSFVVHWHLLCVRKEYSPYCFEYHRGCEGLTPPCWLVSGQAVAYALCDVCNLQLTSDAQAQLHYNGKSHLRRLRQLQAGETGLQSPGTLESLPKQVYNGRIKTKHER